MKLIPCFRCGGTGHYSGGDCFTCNGSGEYNAERITYLLAQTIPRAIRKAR
jgi:DnaJ-class molecular chaperone